MERNIGMDLENVYFFNGSAYAGKSTMVKDWQKNMTALLVRKIITNL